MATFTIEFGGAIKLGGGEVVFAGEQDNEHTKIVGGIFESVFEKYPLFDDAYRDRLNGLIIDRYYNQEIGHETVNKFRLQLRAHLNENMPFFNQMYESTLIEFDPLRTMDLRSIGTNTGTQSSTATGTNDSETTTGSSSRQVFSDLPQTMLAGNEDYASNASDANSGATVTAGAEQSSESEVASENESDTHQYGYSGSPAELLQTFRDMLANVDIMVLDSFEPLFMSVWQSGDSYTMQTPQSFVYPRF